MTRAERELVENLIGVGFPMANLCYNYGQFSRFEPPQAVLDKRTLEMMAAMARKWDTAVTRFRIEMMKGIELMKGKVKR